MTPLDRAGAGVEVATAAHATARSAVRRDHWLERLSRLVDVDSGRDAPEGREEVAALIAEWASPDEYIDLDSWSARCGLLAGLICVPGVPAPSSSAPQEPREGEDP